MNRNKKDKRPYSRSFARRLTWRIMLTLFVVMTITSYFIFQISIGIMYGESYVFLKYVLKNKAQTVEGLLSEVSVSAVNTVPELEEHLDSPERIHDIVERIVRLNPHIQSCGVCFKAGYYPEKGRWFCPFATRVDSNVVERRTLGGATFDYLNEEWFTQGMASEKGEWGRGFFSDADSVTPLVPFIIPVRDAKGETVAVLGVDFSLKNFSFAVGSSASPSYSLSFSDSLSSTQKEWTADNEAYYFIIDSTGCYLSHPDARRVLKKNFFDFADKSPEDLDNYLGRQMTAGETDYFFDDEDDVPLRIEGEKVYVAYRPIENTGWSMALVMPTLFINVVGYILAGVMLLIILVGLIVVFFAGRRSIKKAVRPLQQLAASADEVAKGNFDTPLPAINSRDEIHQLRDSFENMQRSLTRYVSELQRTTAQKASMESELKIAHDIQMDMLPKTFPPYPERHDIDIFGSLTPAKAVGGDLFDFFLRDEKLFFCIGDVSGKGVPASLFMTVARSLFRNTTADVQAPEQIVSMLNNALADGNESSMFVTLFIGVLDLSTGLLRYCNAGHNEPLLIGGNGIVPLPCKPNLPVGIIAGFEFVRQETMLEPQTTLFLYTDGLNEAEDNSHAQFGEERIIAIALQQLALQQHQPQQLINSITGAVHQFVNGAEQSDDLTMLAIQYTKTK